MDIKKEYQRNIVLYNILLIFFLVCNLYCQTDYIFDENFDPSNLVEPDLVLPLIIKPFDDNPQYLNNAIDDSIIDGYRIQVTSTNNLDFANSLSIKIKEKFNYETYIIFDSPNYKLRVGNFALRSNAENVRINLINHGYKKSWIIRTKIYKK